MPSRQTVTQDHAQHDRLLVARFAAGDAYASEVDDARQLVDSCADCNKLAADIRLISAATARLPTVARPRDFRVNAQAAERLSGSRVERLMRRLSAPRWNLVRPLAGAAVAAGLTLAVVGALPLTNRTAPTSDFSVAAPSVGAAQVESAPSVVDLQAPVAGQQAVASYPSVAVLPSAAGSGGSGTGQSAGSAASAAPVPAAQVPAASIARPSAGSVDTFSSAAPPKLAATPAPVLGTPPATARPVATAPNVAVVLPPVSPPAQDAQGSGAPPGTTTDAAAGGTTLILIGAAVAAIGLVVFLVFWLARRRYSDPLIR